MRFVCLIGLAAGVALGCNLSSRRPRPVPLPPGVEPNELIDRDHKLEADNPLAAEELQEAERLIRRFFATEMQGKEPTDKERKNILVLSGGGSLGAYSAGLLVGWSASGTRPTFDVVTGVSTGALIAPFAFLGSDFDPILRHEYTTITNDDLFTRRPPVRSLFAESFADNAPLRRRIEGLVTYERMRRVAAEHAKGRRLYLGTTNLDTKRLVVWDMGAIATRGTPEARQLIVEVMLASSAAPGFFPPSRFNVTIDGVPYEELHVDGGVTRSMFFRPPYIPPSQLEAPTRFALYRSNLFVLVAGKIYADPAGVRPRALRIALAALSSLLYANTRGDLAQLYSYSVLTGMNYFISAIPPRYETGDDAFKFDPAAMTRLFNLGYDLGRQGVVRRVPTKSLAGKTGVRVIRENKAKGESVILGPGWQDYPPGLKPGEELRARSSLTLTVEPPPVPPPPVPARTEAIPAPRPVKEK
ncbi:MAG TPA: patatin-like phospholipase family protein [Gemmatimonadales bacterium]|nr:patatin-like phospholipase family protein [Gemmatimonadales bacterium]